MGKYLQCDVSRLLRRFEDKLTHTGIDRVNHDYAKWVIRSGGGMCVQRGHRLERVSGSMGTTLLAGVTHSKETACGKPGASRFSSLRKLLSKISKLPSPEAPASAIILNTSHAWLARMDVWNWLRQRGNRVVTFIHDLIPIEFPEYARPIEKTRHAERINNALLFSRGIVVNSICTELSLREYARKNGLAVPPVLVAPVGHSLESGHGGELPSGIRSPYFLFLGTIEPRKNHLTILTVWREMVRRLGSETPMLVIVGRRGWECEQIIDLLDRCEAIHPYVRELNEASDEMVGTLIRGARALLLPSFAEGFGIPVQEALAAGTPVIASPLPTFEEIAGEIPEYAEPFDGVRWLHLIMDYANPESSLRARQMERLHGFKETTWDSHFTKIGAFLETVQ